MSTPTITLSPHIREELITILRSFTIQSLADDLDDIALNGYPGLNNMTDEDLVYAYEIVFGIDVLDASSVDPYSETDNTEMHFTSKLMLDVATNGMIHAES